MGMRQSPGAEVMWSDRGGCVWGEAGVGGQAGVLLEWEGWEPRPHLGGQDACFLPT